jgi:hypothetical protein
MFGLMICVALGLFVLARLVKWVLGPPPDASPEEMIRIHLILLLLHYLESTTPKLEFYLPEEILRAGGGTLRSCFGPFLEPVLQHMEQVRLITSRISQRKRAQTMDSDTPKEYRLAQAGYHLLEHGPPKGLRPPLGPTPPRPPSAV